MKKKYYIFLIILIIVIFGISIIYIVPKKRNNEIKEVNIENTDIKNMIVENIDVIENTNKVEENTVITNVTSEELEEMKKNINASGNTDIYQVETEKDGRKILQIKPQVQFYVDTAGIVKKSKPTENELQGLVEKIPIENGIWISEQSRNAFLKLLNKNNIEGFYVTEAGYLKNNKLAKGEIETGLEKMVNSNKLYIINITGVAYERDYISGEIVEYPFEDMDPEQVLETYNDENKTILELSTNKKQKLTDKEILEAILKY